MNENSIRAPFDQPERERGRRKFIFTRDTRKIEQTVYIHTRHSLVEQKRPLLYRIDGKRGTVEIEETKLKRDEEGVRGKEKDREDDIR